MDVVQKLNFDSCEFDEEEEIQANSSGCDALDSSVEDIGPLHHHLPLNRRLTFGNSLMDCQFNDTETIISPIKPVPMIQVNSRTPSGKNEIRRIS